MWAMASFSKCILLPTTLHFTLPPSVLWSAATNLGSGATPPVSVPSHYVILDK